MKTFSLSTNAFWDRENLIVRQFTYQDSHQLFSYICMMDIIIETGYERINHSIQFQPETVPKGKALVKAGHVLHVKEYRRNGISDYIQASVVRQTSVTSTAYTTKLNINSARTVTSVSCTCVYNQSSKCKHVSALIAYINDEENLTKTSHEKQWGKPSAKQFALEKYSKGRYFFEMYPPKVKPNIEPIDLDISDLSGPLSLKMIELESLKDPVKESVKNVMESMLNEVKLMLQKSEYENCLVSIFELVTSNKIYSLEYYVEERLADFFVEYIVLTKEETIKLCSDTVEQSKCKDWFNARRLRVSASKSVHSIKSRVTKSLDSLVAEMLFPKKIQTSATKYGNENEYRARKEYERRFAVQVMKVGVIVSIYQPWLCASLDGIIMENQRVSRIVEFKCPITCKDKPVVDFESQKCNLGYLQICDRVVTLKKSSPYYTQCQIQMYVCGANKCDLFIFSPIANGSISIPIIRD